MNQKGVPLHSFVAYIVSSCIVHFKSVLNCSAISGPIISTNTHAQNADVRSRLQQYMVLTVRLIVIYSTWLQLLLTAMVSSPHTSGTGCQGWWPA